MTLGAGCSHVYVSLLCFSQMYNCKLRCGCQIKDSFLAQKSPLGICPSLRDDPILFRWFPANVIDGDDFRFLVG